MRKILPTNDLFVSFVPPLKTEVLTARALPCRSAAVQTLLLIMRELPEKKSRDDIINFFKNSKIIFFVKYVFSGFVYSFTNNFISDVAKHESCQRRRLIADAVSVVLDNFSKEFFLENFFDTVVEMSKDPVWNIRLQICKLFAKIKNHLGYPVDEPVIGKMETAVRELLSEDINIHNRQMVQQVRVTTIYDFTS